MKGLLIMAAVISLALWYHATRYNDTIDIRTDTVWQSEAHENQLDQLANEEIYQDMQRYP